MSTEPPHGSDAVELSLEIDLPTAAVVAHLAHPARALEAHRRVRPELTASDVHVASGDDTVHVQVDGLATTRFRVSARCDGTTRLHVVHAQTWPRLPLLAAWLAPLVSAG